MICNGQARNTLPDLSEYHENRCNVRPEDLKAYAGQFVVWSLDGRRMLASGEDRPTVARLLQAAGIDPSEVVHDFIDAPEGERLP